MSVLTRPAGDHLALCYGTDWMSAQEVQGLAELTFVDVLCNDGMNYRAIVLKNQDGHGVLHFLNWAKRFDFKGALTKLYLAKHRTYTAGLSEQNCYSVEEVYEQTSYNNEQMALRRATLPPSPPQKEDLLSKPRLKLSRKSVDGRNANTTSRTVPQRGQQGSTKRPHDKASKPSPRKASKAVKISDESLLFEDDLFSSGESDVDVSRPQLALVAPPAAAAVTALPDAGEVGVSSHFTIIDESESPPPPEATTLPATGLAVHPRAAAAPHHVSRPVVQAPRAVVHPASATDEQLTSKAALMDTQLTRLKEARRNLEGAIAYLQKQRDRLPIR